MGLNRAYKEWELIVAMTNEERFIASCQSVGEADVRQKLNANRYGGRRAEWASSWLEQVESGKSDATRAEERSSGLPATGRNRHFGLFALLFAVLIAGVVAFYKLV